MTVLTSHMHVLMGVSSDLYLHDPLRQCQHAEVPRHAHMLDGIYTQSAYTIASCRSTEPHPPLTTTYPATSLPELVVCAWWLSNSCSVPRSSPRSVRIMPLQSHATHALVSKSSEHQEVSHSVLCVMWSSTGCTMHGFNSQAGIP